MPRYGSPVWDAKNPHVPVDNDGNWLSYPAWNHAGWLKVKPFHATLTVDSVRTGRSSKVVVLVDDAGKSYPMFVADLVKGIKDGSLEIVAGQITATWTVSKRGANYGIRSIK